MAPEFPDAGPWQALGDGTGVTEYQSGWELVPEAYSGFFNNQANGTLVYREVSAPSWRFVVDVTPEALDGGHPRARFNNAGILARATRHMGSGTENWVMVDVGYQNDRYGILWKNTVNGSSETDGGSPQPFAGFGGPRRLAMCRNGEAFRFCISGDAGGFLCMGTAFERNDFPGTLDVGMVAGAFEDIADLRARFSEPLMDFPPDFSTDCSEGLDASVP